LPNWRRSITCERGKPYAAHSIKMMLEA